MCRMGVGGELRVSSAHVKVQISLFGQVLFAEGRIVDGSLTNRMVDAAGMVCHAGIVLRIDERGELAGGVPIR